MQTIAVLITVHNRKSKTLACLKHLFAASKPKNLSIEVFLVDDGSTDGTSEAVRKKYPEVNLIHGTGDLFWNQGMRLAWETAAQTKDYDFYLWLNDDTLIYKNVLEALLSTSIQYENKSIIVGTTCAVNNKQQITYGGRTKQNGLLVPQDSPLACDFFNGNIVLIPKAVYEKNGINDPSFRHALGDFDYGLRARKLRIQIYIAPGILGECDVHETLATWCNPQKTINHRWKAFRSPLGNNPKEFFIFENRHNGFIMACFHYITNYLRVLFPWIWKIK